MNDTAPYKREYTHNIPFCLLKAFIVFIPIPAKRLNEFMYIRLDTKHTDNSPHTDSQTINYFITLRLIYLALFFIS